MLIRKSVNATFLLMIAVVPRKIPIRSNILVFTVKRLSGAITFLHELLRRSREADSVIGNAVSFLFVKVEVARREFYSYLFPNNFFLRLMMPNVTFPPTSLAIFFFMRM